MGSAFFFCDRGQAPATASVFPFSKERTGVEIFVVDSALEPVPDDFRKVLSEEERKKAEGFSFPWLTKRYLIGRSFLRKVIGAVIEEDPSHLVFGTGAFGKPYLRRRPPLYFSLSYSRTMIILALADRPVGIDIEFLNPEFDFSDIVSLYFSGEESAFIARSQNPMDAFFLLWTRKEAILKALGVGLVDDLHQIPSLDGLHHADLKTEHASDDTWGIQSFLYGFSYRISVAYPDANNLFAVAFYPTSY